MSNSNFRLRALKEFSDIENSAEKLMKKKAQEINPSDPRVQNLFNAWRTIRTIVHSTEDIELFQKELEYVEILMSCAYICFNGIKPQGDTKPKTLAQIATEIRSHNFAKLVETYNLLKYKFQKMYLIKNLEQSIEAIRTVLKLVLVLGS